MWGGGEKEEKSYKKYSANEIMILNACHLVRSRSPPDCSDISCLFIINIIFFFKVFSSVKDSRIFLLCVVDCGVKAPETRIIFRCWCFVGVREKKHL